MSRIIMQSENDLPQAATEFIRQMGDHRIFAFYGEMGAGKTTLIKEICRQMEVKDNVSSPTFALVYEYSTVKGTVYHFDFYRVKELSELFDLGYEDYFYSGEYCFIEWPEMAEHILPEKHVKVKISVGKEGARLLEILPGDVS